MENNSIDLEQLLLTTIANEGEIKDTWELSVSKSLDHQAIVGALKSLLVDKYVIDEPITTVYWTLTAEGEAVSLNGSPEIQVLKLLQQDSEKGMSVKELQDSLGTDTVKVGMAACMKNKWVEKKGDLMHPTAADVVDETSEMLRKISLSAIPNPVSEDDLKTLKKRKLAQQVTRKSYRLLQGPDFKPQRTRKMAYLNKSMLGNKAEVVVVTTVCCCCCCCCCC